MIGDKENSTRCWQAKYVLEWLLAALGFFTVLPLLGLLAIAVKLSSAGPVFYVTERLGRNGKIFHLYKFRSMKTGVGPVFGTDGKVLTLDNDPRLTSIGWFLRLGFDELPQLTNVLRGEMCLIGPRPDIPPELGRYTSRERLRLFVLPGITGLAQVVGGRGMNNAQNYELDVRYVESSTFFTDLLILVVTLPYSLGLHQVGRRVLGLYLNGIEQFR